MLESETRTKKGKLCEKQNTFVKTFKLGNTSLASTRNLSERTERKCTEMNASQCQTLILGLENHYTVCTMRIQFQYELIRVIENLNARVEIMKVLKVERVFIFFLLTCFKKSVVEDHCSSEWLWTFLEADFPLRTLSTTFENIQAFIQRIFHHSFSIMTNNEWRSRMRSPHEINSNSNIIPSRVSTLFALFFLLFLNKRNWEFILWINETSWMLENVTHAADFVVKQCKVLSVHLLRWLMINMRSRFPSSSWIRFSLLRCSFRLLVESVWWNNFGVKSKLGREDIPVRFNDTSPALLLLPINEKILLIKTLVFRTSRRNFFRFMVQQILVISTVKSKINREV